MLTRFKKYFDEPQALMRDWRYAQTRAMREALAEQLAADAPGWPVEQIIHDDESEPDSRPIGRAGLVRRLFYGRAALHAAARLEAKLQMRDLLGTLCVFVLLSVLGFVLLAGLFDSSQLASGTDVKTVATQVASKVAALCLIVIGGYLAWLGSGVSSRAFQAIVPAGKVLEPADVDDVHAFNSRVLLRTVNANAPEDLVDLNRPLTFDADGNPVDGQIVGDDYSVSWLSSALTSSLLIFLGSGATVALAGVSLLVVPLMYPVAIFSAGCLVYWAGAKLVLLPELSVRRGMGAREALARSPSAKLVEQNGSLTYSIIEEAKQQQLVDAIADKSAFIEIGRSKGLLASRGDPFAPSCADMPFGLTVDGGLATHTIVLGKTGSGKTECVLKPLTAEWSKLNAGGLMVMDGKGVLPEDVSTYIKDFKVITPGSVFNFAALQNLSPDQVANALYDANCDKSGTKDPFWDHSATDHIRHSGKMLALLIDLGEPDWKWTLECLYKIIFDPSSLSVIKEVIASDSDKEVFGLMPLHMRSAYNYLTAEFPVMAPQTATGILQNVSVWLGKMVNNELFSKWASCEEGVLIEDTLEGAKMGILLPKAKYGPAGVAFSILAKERFYGAFKRRGVLKAENGQVPVLLVMDEVQELLTESDADMLAVSRQMGMYSFSATQNIEGIKAALKNQEDKTMQLLGNFSSGIFLPVNTEASRDFVSERMGFVAGARITSMASPAADAASTMAGMQLEAGGFGPGTMPSKTVWTKNISNMRGIGSIAGDAWAMLNQISEKTGMSKAASKITDAFKDKSDCPQVTIGNHLLVTPEEIQSLTAVRFSALCAVNRNGVDRRDLIQMTPMYKKNPTQISVGSEVAA